MVNALSLGEIYPLIKNILFRSLFSVVKDMLACQTFRKFLKISKFTGELNNEKISSTYRR